MEGAYTPISISPEGLIDGSQTRLQGRINGPARRSTRGQWTAEEDEILKIAVQRFKGKNWKKIAECFKDRTDVQCLHRWQKVLNPELVKGPWTKEEDERIIQLVQQFGPKKWSTISRYLPGRIGKQCRERWHNHLNPAINKDAWTEEEELILIRLHQIYGNRWAELTKYLPGRTDNGIKNHWHSCVKKKLDFYMASGLVPFQKSSMLSSSFVMQGEDAFGCSAGLSERESQSGQSSCENEEATLSSYHLHHYFYPKEEQSVAITIPQVPCEITSSSHDSQFELPDLPETASFELNQEFSELTAVCMSEAKRTTTASIQTPLCLEASPSMPSMYGSISDAECCRVLFPDQKSKKEADVHPIHRDPLLSTSLVDNMMPEAKRTPSKETLRPAALIISSEKRAKESARLICHPFEAEEPKGSVNANDSFLCIDDPSSSSLCVTDNSSDQQDQSYHVNDSKKLVPVNDFASLPNVKPSSPLIKREPDVNKEQLQEDSGASTRECLHFPSLDLDTVQSKNEMMQDYSPLGIRKLLMSTMTCLSPLRLWDSPSRYHTSNAVFKTGKNAFVDCTSILKKRRRDLLSPLSETRCDKKLETDVASSLAKDFSRLDVMFDESCKQESSVLPPTSVISRDEEKENHSQALNGGREEDGKDKTCLETHVEEANSVKNLDGVLAESNTDRSDQAISMADKLQRTLMVSSNRDNYSTSLCLVINSPSQRRNTKEHLFDKSASNTADDNLSIFCRTPFRRSFESPSAWNSPLFKDSFFCSPRFDAEDIGYLFSPGDRSYSSVGYIKQSNEHIAADTSKAASKQKQYNPDKENFSVLPERRVLDFNDYESPVKPTPNIKASAAL